MYWKLVMVVATLSLAAGLGGCGSPEVLALTDADAGTSHEMSVGDKLTVTLESNPTTGYRWDVDGDLPPQLALVGEPEFTPESSAMGAGGTEVWTFQAADAGSAKLGLKYWRSFEETVPPVKKWSVDVNVR